ncbi:acyltransferase family protein [Erythrobacter sp. GH3-10]|uniref:Acyltransferase family protein n=1 Tax=Aurantiacibacter rhizosphaerae TaxID=2691582 RepID=A0A844XCH2_9SPHN|nr:acyltransferase family protein [Aurantiacibacter rhizosphaerae]
MKHPLRGPFQVTTIGLRISLLQCTKGHYAQFGVRMLGRNERYHTLDAIRGVAAIVVAYYHFLAGAGYLGFGQPWIQGYLAVDLFFALSGFVIALSYEDKLRDGMGVGTFMMRRIIRLYPLFFLGLILGGGFLVLRAMLGATPDYSVSEVALEFGANLFMLPTLRQDWLFPLNIPAWSLFFRSAGEHRVRTYPLASFARDACRPLPAVSDRHHFDRNSRHSPWHRRADGGSAFRPVSHTVGLCHRDAAFPADQGHVAQAIPVGAGAPGRRAGDTSLAQAYPISRGGQRGDRFPGAAAARHQVGAPCNIAKRVRCTGGHFIPHVHDPCAADRAAGNGF